MKKIIIIFILIFIYKLSYALVYSERAILNEVYYKKATLSKGYKNNFDCVLHKKTYNKKFPEYIRGNCFLRDKDSLYYYFIYNLDNFEQKNNIKNNIVNNTIDKKIASLDNNTNILYNSFGGKYIDLENVKKFDYILKIFNNNKFKSNGKPKIEIIDGKLYFLNIYLDIDFNKAFSKKIYDPFVLKYYNDHSSEIKKYLNFYRKQKTCDYSIKKASKKILSYLYFNNIFIRTNDLSKDIACYIYKNKANYSVNELCTVYKPYRKTNITKGLYSMKLTYPIWKAGKQVNTLYGLFSNGIKYVDGLALKTEKGKVKTFKVKGGGLCGVSTILYNFNLNQKKLFNITERWPHMGYYRGYYGPKIGIDATIFGPTKNYKFVNITDEDIIWDYFTYKKGWKFCYGIKAWKLRPFPSKTKISSKRYKKNCYKNIVYDPKTWKVLHSVKSCYREIN